MGRALGRAVRVCTARRRGRLALLTGAPPADPSIYSPGHDPRVRRTASRRRSPVVRWAHREPPGARPERHDPYRLLGIRRPGSPDDLPARGARVRQQGRLAGDRGVQPLAPRRRLPRRGRPALPSAVAGDGRSARRNPGRRGRRGETLLAALLLVPAGECPPTDPRPARPPP